MLGCAVGPMRGDRCAGARIGEGRLRRWGDALLAAAGAGVDPKIDYRSDSMQRHVRSARASHLTPPAHAPAGAVTSRHDRTL